MDTNEMIEAFFAFVYERQLIWHKRTILHLPAPWTEDKILQTYKFCNVYRQLDAGTLAISKYLQAEYSPEQKLFNIIAFIRYKFNKTFSTTANFFFAVFTPVPKLLLQNGVCRKGRSRPQLCQIHIFP